MIGQSPPDAPATPAADAPLERAAVEPAASKPGGAQGEAAVLPPEVGGREGLEPTRYGDWEKNGRCIDF